MDWSSDWKMAIVFIAIIVNAWLVVRSKKKAKQPEHKGWR